MNENKIIIEGKVIEIEESTYSYGDIVDDKYSSLLVRPLLKFEGKKIRITIELLDI